MERSKTHFINLLRKRDEEAFKEVYYTHSEKLYSVAFQILKDDVLAQEVVQEAFIVLWKNLEELSRDTNLWSYLYVIARRNCLNKLRQLSVSMKYVNEAREILETPSTFVMNKLESVELQLIINNCLAQLPPKQREVFQMSREEGKTHIEIAQELNLSPHTVRNHIVAVLRKLRDKLKSYGYHITLFVLFFLF